MCPYVFVRCPMCSAAVLTCSYVFLRFLTFSYVFLRVLTFSYVAYVFLRCLTLWVWHVSSCPDSFNNRKHKLTTPAALGGTDRTPILLRMAYAVGLHEHIESV
jgi:hypothetical protein